VVCDLVEENWPSMELVGEMLHGQLQAHHSSFARITKLLPSMKRRFGALPVLGGSGAAFNGDRLLNRFWDYPRWLRRQRTDFDLFHVVDHSYSQLVHELPPERTVVTCHDLDTFRCLLEPEQEPRPAWFRKMMQRTLDGLRRAARVVCDSTATYDQVLRYGLAPAERALVIPLGIHPAYSAEPDPVADAEARRLLGMVGGGPWLLHVGSTIQRKRIDVLLEVFASVRRKFPRARLIRVGGPFTAEQMELAQRLRVAKAITVLPFLTREVVAAVYRRAALVLLPSEREGFGLPVAEALACGVPVVASDLAVLREVGGEAATYCPVADTNAWDETIAALLDERQDDPIKWAQRRDEGLAQAAQFTWTEHARKLVALYQELLT
jgi:glycosyltransferase involved in cell wall biosynthesis